MLPITGRLVSTLLTHWKETCHQHFPYGRYSSQTDTFTPYGCLHKAWRRMRLKRDGTRAETWFRLSAKRTSPFISAGTSVQSTTGSRAVRISGSNDGYTMFRGSVKDTGYPLHSPISPPMSHRVPSRFNWTLPQNGISDTILTIFERRKLLPLFVQNGRLSNCTPHTDVWLATPSEHSTETPQFTVILPTKKLVSSQPAVRPRNLNPVQFSSTRLPNIILFPAQKVPGSNSAPQTDYSETYWCCPQSTWKNAKIISRITQQTLPYQFPILTTLPYHTMWTDLVKIKHTNNGRISQTCPVLRLGVLGNKEQMMVNTPS